jgi:hypothetical protein
LSDSKGASAAISTEAAILCMQRSMRGFLGPRDIFRNPEAIWRQFEPTGGDSPFGLVLSHSGDDFAVMGMHFKLGLYEHPLIRACPSHSFQLKVTRHNLLAKLLLASIRHRFSHDASVQPLSNSPDAVALPDVSFAPTAHV